MDSRNRPQTKIIVEIVKKYSTVDIQKYGTSAQIYLHLNIWGDDFDEMIAEIAQVTGTDFSTFSPNEYSPNEGGALIASVCRFFGYNLYRSLSIIDLIKAAEAGKWSRDQDSRP